MSNITLCVPLALLVACAPGDESTEDPREVVSSTAVGIGPDGGVVELGGASLTIPPGALDEEVDIVLVELEERPAEPYVGLSHVWRAEPTDLVFAEPAQLALPFEDGEAPTLYWTPPDGVGVKRVLDQALLGGTLQGLIDRLGEGFVSEPVVELEQETFVVEPTSYDLLLVVDDSASMEGEQANLVAGLPALMLALGTSDLDWHVGVVTTDMDSPSGQGRLRQAQGQLFVEADTPGPVSVLADMVRAGIGGSGDEKGLAAVQSAYAYRDGLNAGFFREGGQLAVVVLSDEDDHSAMTVDSFGTWLVQTAVEGATFSSFVTPPGVSPLTGAETGTRYLTLTDAIGGRKHDIRDSAMDAPLRDVVELAHGAVFPLAGDADPATLEVEVTGADGVARALPAGSWTFDGDAALLELSVRAGVAPGDTVVVRYSTP